MNGVMLTFQNGEIWISMPASPAATSQAAGTAMAMTTSFSLSAHIRKLMVEALAQAKLKTDP